MNDTEKTATTVESVSPTIDETSALSESTLASAIHSDGSESENALSGSERDR